MTQEHTHYGPKNTPTMAEMAHRPCTRRFSDPGYIPPTWSDLRDLMALMGWQGADVAAITGAASTAKAGSRTVRRWTADPDKTQEARNIPYAAWRLLLIESGIVGKVRGAK